MAPTTTTADVFGAMAEPHRRRIVDLLAEGERSVNDLVERTGLAQPQVSKHLRVLREVGVVVAREEGRRRLYSLNGLALKPIHDWVTGFAALWAERYEALDAVLEDLKKETGDVGDQ
jgi:DNA-binding transcriptional ArsR family regulator